MTSHTAITIFFSAVFYNPYAAQQTVAHAVTPVTPVTHSVAHAAAMAAAEMIGLCRPSQTFHDVALSTRVICEGLTRRVCAGQRVQRDHAVVGM